MTHNTEILNVIMLIKNYINDIEKQYLNRNSKIEITYEHEKNQNSDSKTDKSFSSSSYSHDSDHQDLKQDEANESQLEKSKYDKKLKSNLKNSSTINLNEVKNISYNINKKILNASNKPRRNTIESSIPIEKVLNEVKLKDSNLAQVNFLNNNTNHNRRLSQAEISDIESCVFKESPYMSRYSVGTASMVSDYNRFKTHSQLANRNPNLNHTTDVKILDSIKNSINKKLYETDSLHLENKKNYIEQKLRYKIKGIIDNNFISMDSKKINNSETEKEEYIQRKSKNQLTYASMKLDEVEVNSYLNSAIDFTIQSIQQDVIIKELNDHPDIGLLMDQEGIIIQYNSMFIDKLKYNNKDCVKIKFKTLVHYFDQQNYIDKLQEFINERDSIEKEGFFDSDISSVPFVIRVSNKFNEYLTFYITLQSVAQSLKNNQSEKRLIKVRLMSKEAYYNDIIIDPRSFYYLCFTVIIVSVLIYIVWNSTYEIGYSSVIIQNDGLFKSIVNTYIITGIFSVDLIQNFFLAYEETNDTFEFEHAKIIYYYLTSYFAIDLISTIPFDSLFNVNNQLASNSQNLKILKFFKLIKLLRLAKVYSFSNYNYIYKNEYFGDLAIFIKSHIGFIELLKVMTFLVIITHFFSCLYFYVKNEHEMNKGDTNLEWMNNYFKFQYLENSPLTIYFKMLCEMLKVALGITTLYPSFNLEVFMDTTWIIIGQAIFGYGIGNISAYLNYANKRENELSETINYFKDLMMENKCDYMYEHVINDVTNYYDNYNINEFNRLSEMLSKNIKNMLETTLYKDFIESHEVFSYLSMPLLRKLKLCKIKSKTNVLKANEVVNSVYFILDGSIKILNTNLCMVNEYKKNEILGMHHFKEYYYRKYKEELIQNSPSDQNSRRNIVRNFLSKSIYKTVNKVVGCNLIYNEIEVRCQYYAVCNDSNTRYLEVDYDTLEDIVKLDIDAFQIIYNHSLKGFEKITQDDVNNSNEIQNYFDNHFYPGLMIKEEGDLYDVNFEAVARLKINNDFNQLNIFEILFRVGAKGDVSIKSFDEIIDGTYHMYINHIQFKLKYHQKQVGKMTRQERFTSHEQYYKLKKSLLDVHMLYFENTDEE